MDPVFALFALGVAVAFTAEAAIGFGGVLLALTFGAHLYPVSTIIPPLVLLSTVIAASIVARHHRHVDWPLLLASILPGAGIGIVAGRVLSNGAPDDVLRTVLGVFVVAVAAVEFARLRPSAAPPAPLGRGGFLAATVGAGLVHGITATGGPVLVYAVGRLGMHKGGFRSTLAATWIALNGALLVTFAAAGTFGADAVRSSALLLPVTIGALFFGEWLHHRFDERTFRGAVLGLLLVAGGTLLV